MTPRKISVFPQPDSLPCDAVKLFLKDRRRSSKSVAWRMTMTRGTELAAKYSRRSIPTVIIGDEVVVGFDPERLDQLLEQ